MKSALWSVKETGFFYIILYYWEDQPVHSILDRKAKRVLE